MGNIRFQWLAVLLIAVCSAAGYAVGNAHRGIAKTNAPPEVARRKSDRPVQQERRTELDPMENFSRLLAGDNRETDIWKVVSRIPPERIQEAIREVAELEKQGTYLARKNEILSALYFHWAENDPKAALAGLPTEPRDSLDSYHWRGLAMSVLTAWTRMDPEAAFSAGKAHANKDFYYMGRDLLVQTWTPENVFQNLDRHPEHRKDLMGWYCASLTTKPEAREAMLNRLKDNPFMEDADTVNFMLFRAWGYEDFDAAVASAKQFYPPTGLKRIIEDNLAMQASKALPCAVEIDLPPGGPKWEKGYAEWLGTNGAEARGWFRNLETTWELDGHADAAAAFLALDYANADQLNLAAEQADAADRFHRLVDRWQKKNPLAVRKWLDTAPAAARELFNAKGGRNED